MKGISRTLLAGDVSAVKFAHCKEARSGWRMVSSVAAVGIALLGFSFPLFGFMGQNFNYSNNNKQYKKKKEPEEIKRVIILIRF